MKKFDKAKENWNVVLGYYTEKKEVTKSDYNKAVKSLFGPNNMIDLLENEAMFLYWTCMYMIYEIHKRYLNDGFIIGYIMDSAFNDVIYYYHNKNYSDEKIKEIFSKAYIFNDFIDKTMEEMVDELTKEVN